jgi:hypothetical protein
MYLLLLQLLEQIYCRHYQSNEAILLDTTSLLHQVRILVEAFLVIVERYDSFESSGKCKKLN